MNVSNTIYKKLNLFYNKFYINELIKGFLLFLAIGLLYFLLILLVEYFFWLNSSFRGFLFWAFISFEAYLFIFLIILPVLQLVKIRKGINYETSAKIIQQHFPNEVGDKLLNVLQLTNDAAINNSELLLIAIEQKIEQLQPIPFLQAINFKSNFKYLPYAFLPIAIFLIFLLTGKQQNLNNSFVRLANYNDVFVKPAPFEFEILNKNLAVKEGEDYVLEFKTIGEIIPNVVSIHFFNETYYAQKVSPGRFKFIFNNVNKAIPFYFNANNFSSKPYTLNLLELPNIVNLEVHVTYPTYLSKKNPIVSNSGNLVVPEGSVINWKINTQNTDKIVYVTNSDSIIFNQNNTNFDLSKKIKSTTSYQIITFNTTNKFTQKVDFSIHVLKDEFPLLDVQVVPDSLSSGLKIYHGKTSDDYGITQLRVVYYDVKQPSILHYHKLPVLNSTSFKFIYQFPNGLVLNEETSYAYYFEVVDNDALNQFKKSKSNTFLHNELNQVQKTDVNLDNQVQQINSLQKSLTQTKTSEKKVNEVNQLLKQNSNLEYKDIKKLHDFFNTELENLQNIEEAAKKLANQLQQKKDKNDSEKAAELQKRLDNLQKEQEKNKKLYDELNKYTDKLSKEELLQKVQKAKQNSAQQKRSLEQLVEQTKRFYVEQRAEQITEKLKKLAKKQEKLSELNTEQLQNQLELNKAFDDIQSDLQELKQENDGLKKPMELPKMDTDSEDTKQEMTKASNKLKQNDNSAAQKSQKSAAQKMKEMAQKLESGMQKGEADQLQEDAKALRQILKNLLKFSFTQESTMKDFKNKGSQSFHFNRLLKEEQKLKNQFRFIDDSLNTLAARQIRIQDVVNKSVSEIHYNIDQSLHHLVENNLNKGISHQQYVINHANVLADLLSEALSNMQSQMQMQGSGEGKPNPGQGDPQLSDIIQKQKGLEQQFQDGVDAKDANNKKEGSGEKTGEGKVVMDGNTAKDDEGESGELLEIYKQQQQLREALEKSLGNQSGNIGLDKILNEMKKLERNLLRKGFSNELLNQFKNLNHELLKLQNALKEQGDDTKRQSNTNENKFNANENQIPKSVLEYIQGTEILQKNTLPLQPKYDNLVKEYFK